MAPIGYLTINKDRVIIESNLTAATLMGINRIDMKDKEVSNFIFPEDQDIFYLHHKNLFTTHLQQTSELRLLRTGLPFWVKIQSTLDLQTTNATSSRTIIIDITKEKQAEEQLMAAKKQAENACQAKSEFLSNMGH